jgi:hypothetical protein
MFEYILAGFTGTFFSYFCVYWAGAESHAFAVNSVSENILSKMNRDTEMIIRNMDINYKASKNKMDEIMHILDMLYDRSEGRNLSKPPPFSKTLTKLVSHYPK